MDLGRNAPGNHPSCARENPSPSSSQRYRAVWRWHFYAGLFVAPILLVLAVTGAVYLFKEPFEEWRYQDVRTLAEPAATARPLSEQIAAAQQARPGAPVMSVIPPASADRTTRVILQGTDTGPFAQGVSVYVDPGTATVVGQIDDGATFMRVVRTIHGELMSGTVGDRRRGDRRLLGPDPHRHRHVPVVARPAYPQEADQAGTRAAAAAAHPDRARRRLGRRLPRALRPAVVGRVG
ncbi:hypothetical protein GCM10020220_074710 [Nonomuraea rubra]